MTLSVYIIAGEPSGDRLGGALMEAMNAEAGVVFHGVGGRDMMAAGLKPLFDMSDLTVMGLSEVLPRLPMILRRIRETVEDIIARKPDVLVTIDAPDFSLRVARRVRKALPDLKTVHYVAPSVWAWRPGRAAKMARHVDHVLALLPFEPPYMEAAGMSCDFVGHPVVTRPVPVDADCAAFRTRNAIPQDRKLLLVAPGSRNGEVRRLGQDFLGTVQRLRQQDPDLHVVCPVAEQVEASVRELLAPLSPDLHFVSSSDGEAEKMLAFAASDAALCASGTVTLEIAAMGTPMVAAYRTTWLTAQIVRRVVKVRTANLINLVSDKDVVPEFLQEYCSVDSLSEALQPLLSDPEAAKRQRDVFDQVLGALGRGGTPPAERAARSVLQFLERVR